MGAHRRRQPIAALTAALVAAASTLALVVSGAASASAETTVTVSPAPCPHPGVRVATITGGSSNGQLRAGTRVLLARTPQSARRLQITLADLEQVARRQHATLAGTYVIAASCVSAGTVATPAVLTAVSVRGKDLAVVPGTAALTLVTTPVADERSGPNGTLRLSATMAGRAVGSGELWVYLDGSSAALGSRPLPIRHGRVIVRSVFLPGRHALTVVGVAAGAAPVIAHLPFTVIGPRWRAVALGLAADTGVGARPWAVRMTATVRDAHGGAGVDGGTIAFYHHGSYLGATRVHDGNATWTWLTALAPVRAYTTTVSARYVPAARSLYTTSVASLDVRVSAAGHRNLKMMDIAGSAGLALTTPFSAQNPVVMPSPVLVTSGQYLESQFTLDPSAGTGIVVTDARSSDLPWTLSLQCTTLTNATGDQINPENLGFIDVTPSYLPGSPLQAGSVVTEDVPAAEAVPVTDTGSAGLGGGVGHPAATAASGAGSVGIGGVLDLKVPTGTPLGDYSGTLTVTVS